MLMLTSRAERLHQMNKSWGVVVSFDTKLMSGSVNVASGYVTAFMAVNTSVIRIPQPGELWKLDYDNGSYSFDSPFAKDMSEDARILQAGDTLISTPEIMSIKAKRLDLKDSNGDLLDEIDGTVSTSRMPKQWLIDLIKDVIK